MAIVWYTASGRCAYEIKLRERKMFNLRTLNILTLLTIVSMVVLWGSCADATDHLIKSSGQTVYAPVYSHIYVGSQGQEFQLAATLSIRNTNLEKSIKLEWVRYYNSSGKLLRNLIEGPIQVAAFSSAQYFIGESDTLGGFGAFFLVRWSSETMVNEPVIEVVTVGTRSGQGISFISSGKVIE